MNFTLFKIMSFLWLTSSERLEKQTVEVMDNAPQGMSESRVEGTLVKGIDVSHWQGKIDWHRVANSNVKHVFVKMSEGKSYVDPNFVANWNGAQAAGLNVNCYHFFRALNATPTAQLRNIKNNLKHVDFNVDKNALAIDVELDGNEKATPKQMADNLNDLLTLIKNDSDLSKVSLLIYTSPGFWRSEVNWKDYDFSVFDLWIAHYNVKIPDIPEPWKSKGKTWVWWQYSDKGHVDGITDNVDLNWVALKGN